MVSFLYCILLLCSWTFSIVIVLSNLFKDLVHLTAFQFIIKYVICNNNNNNNNYYRQNKHNFRLMSPKWLTVLFFINLWIRAVQCMLYSIYSSTTGFGSIVLIQYMVMPMKHIKMDQQLIPFLCYIHLCFSMFFPTCTQIRSNFELLCLAPGHLDRWAGERASNNNMETDPWKTYLNSMCKNEFSKKEDLIQRGPKQSQTWSKMQATWKEPTRERMPTLKAAWCMNKCSHRK